MDVGDGRTRTRYPQIDWDNSTKKQTRGRDPLHEIFRKPRSITVVHEKDDTHTRLFQSTIYSRVYRVKLDGGRVGFPDHYKLRIDADDGEITYYTLPDGMAVVPSDANYGDNSRTKGFEFKEIELKGPDSRITASFPILIRKLGAPLSNHPLQISIVGVEPPLEIEWIEGESQLPSSD